MRTFRYFCFLLSLIMPLSALKVRLEVTAMNQSANAKPAGEGQGPSAGGRG